MQFEDFEWDEDKRLKNLVGRKIDFESVPPLFDNPYLSIRSDRSGEERYFVLGIVGGETLAVVYTPRGDRCRIISARKASRHEREAYRKAFEE
jgi:uncharacterized DUF497 family protein